MYLTEEEARGKWCIVAMQDLRKNCNCIASKCMAWRWAGFETCSDTGMSCHEDESECHGCPDRLGFCGLAGRE